MITCAIFDLDGTLVNTIDDLGACCDMLLKKYNKDYSWSREDYKKFVGNGSKMLVKRAFNDTLSPSELDDMNEEFKVLYNVHKLDNAFAYDGIKEQLSILKSKGIKLCVVTNKPNKSAVEMVKHIFGDDMFDFIVGAHEDVPKKPDPTTVFQALDFVNEKAENSIYFGDSDVDIKTAKNAGIESVAVTWGFRSFDELFSQNPSVIIDDTKYISKLF